MEVKKILQPSDYFVYPPSSLQFVTFSYTYFFSSLDYTLTSHRLTKQKKINYSILFYVVGERVFLYKNCMKNRESVPLAQFVL